MPGGGKRVRGGREIRLTQRENENEGRDVSTIDHRDSECNANHAPSLVSVPPTARSRTYPRQLYFTRRPSPPRRFSYPSLALPPPTSLLWHRAGKISTLTPTRPISTTELHPRYLSISRWRFPWIREKNRTTSSRKNILSITQTLLIGNIWQVSH